MASVASQLTEEVTAHAQSDSLEDAREICADGSYFPNNLRICSARVLPPPPFPSLRMGYVIRIAVKNRKWMIEPLYRCNVGNTPLLQEVKSCGCDEVLPIEGSHTLQGEETVDYEQWWNDV